MKTYIISYDLLNPGQDYTALHDAIKAACTSWAHPLESFWLVTADTTASQLRDYLKSYMDGNDKLFVATVGRQWAGSNLGSAVYKWLKDNWIADLATA